MRKILDGVKEPKEPIFDLVQRVLDDCFGSIEKIEQAAAELRAYSVVLEHSAEQIEYAATCRAGNAQIRRSKFKVIQGGKRRHD